MKSSKYFYGQVHDIVFDDTFFDQGAKSRAWRLLNIQLVIKSVYLLL